MLLQFNQLILLDLLDLSEGTILTIILIHVKTFHLLPSIVLMGEFFQDAAQFNIECCLNIME